jgi:hypothetical protein
MKKLCSAITLVLPTDILTAKAQAIDTCINYQGGGFATALKSTKELPDYAHDHWINFPHTLHNSGELIDLACKNIDPTTRGSSYVTSYNTTYLLNNCPATDNDIWGVLPTELAR